MIESYFWRRLLVRSGLARLLPRIRRELGGAEAYLHQYSDRTLALPLTQLLDTSLLPNVATPDSINLALGSPICEASLSLDRRARECQTDAWGLSELRADLANEFQLNHGPEHEPADEVLITHGASGAFAATLDAFINPGDRAVLFDPTSPIFSIGLRHRRARIHWVPTWSDAGRVRFAMDVFAKAMRGAKLLVLADPANPTGCVFAPEDLEQIAFWARKQDAIIFQDASFDRWRSEPAKGFVRQPFQADCGFSDSDDLGQSSQAGKPDVLVHGRAPTKGRIAALPNAEGRILTCGSFAKSHGLSAARVGWLIGNRHLVRPCAGAAMMAAPFVPAICQHLALQAMHMGESEIPGDFNTRREYVRERLKSMGLHPWDAAGGFFFWMPTPGDESGRDFAQRLLRETGVLVNPGSPFGPSGEKFIRVSFATDEGRLREGLNRLAKFLSLEPTHGLPVAQLLP